RDNLGARPARLGSNVRPKPASETRAVEPIARAARSHVAAAPQARGHAPFSCPVWELVTIHLWNERNRHGIAGAVPGAARGGSVRGNRAAAFGPGLFGRFASGPLAATGGRSRAVGFYGSRPAGGAIDAGHDTERLVVCRGAAHGDRRRAPRGSSAET